MSYAQGSPYGVGAYGKGAYGYATRIFGLAAATTGKMRPSLQVNAQLNIESAAPMAMTAWRLWPAVPVAPCQAWGPIGNAGCWTAVPNSFGRMFPGLAT